MQMLIIRTAAAASVAVVAALTVGTAIAGADAKDDAFIASLNKVGVTVGDANAARGLGLLICGDLRNGRTPDQIAQDFMEHGLEVVTAAKQSYCP